VGKNLKERDHLEDRGIDGIKMKLTETVCGVWSGFNWLKTVTGGGLL
jgi:hypothetical protein